jgi:peroxiredoxin
MTALQVDDTAPDFTLEATTGNQLRLSGALSQGPVVLIFYRFDFGPI